MERTGLSLELIDISYYPYLCYTIFLSKPKMNFALTDISFLAFSYKCIPLYV